MAVMESKLSTFKEEKSELDNDLKDLTAQINALNIQIPGLINGIDGLTGRIDGLTGRINSHESNADTRGKEVEKHKIQCGNISTNVRNLWVVVGFIFTIIGILIVLMFRVK